MGLFSNLRGNNNEIEIEIDKDKKINIEKTNTIDGIGTSNDGSTLIMLITNRLDWHDENRHLYLLNVELGTEDTF